MLGYSCRIEEVQMVEIKIYLVEEINILILEGIYV